MCVVDWAILLEYIRVLFGWPVVTAAIVAVFFTKFSTGISTKLSGLREVGFPGGTAKFDPTASQAPPLGDAARGLDLPHVDPSKDVVPHAINRQVSDRTKKLLADTSTTPPQLADAVAFAQANPGPTFDRYIDSLFRTHCEKTFSTIFGSQLLALEYIIAKGPEASIPLSHMSGFVKAHAEKAASAGQSPLSEEHFVGFLLRNFLIQNVGEPNAPSYRGTFTGEQFLAYIKDAYPFLWNSRAY